MTRLMTLAFACATVSAAVWVGLTAQRDLRADLTAGPARFSIQRWAEGESQPTSRAQWEAAVSEIESAVAIHPREPSLNEVLGNAWIVGVRQKWGSNDDKSRWLQRAIGHFRIATVERPNDGLLWALLASALTRSGDYGAEMQAAAQRALNLGPNEAHVQHVLVQVTLRHWDNVGPQLQKWTSDYFENGTQAQRDTINLIGSEYGIELESDKPARDPNRGKSQGSS
jgi:hypothetical protein